MVRDAAPGELGGELRGGNINGGAKSVPQLRLAVLLAAGRCRWHSAGAAPLRLKERRN